MNERLEKYLEKARQFFSQLSNPKKIALGAGAGVLAIASIAGTALFTEDPYQILYSDLTIEGSKAVTKKLADLGVEYQVRDDQATIAVPRSMIHTARMELAKEGLPGEGVVGFETFDNFSFGTSSYVQRIQYIRAVQGELTRSIQRINAVKRSRVHISVPPKKTFLEDQEPPKASVVLELHPGKTLSKAEIKSISHVVASAVERLEHKHVTIIDTHGKFLHRPDQEGDSGQSLAILELQRKIEGEYEKRVEDLLAPVVGMGKVIAKVTAELDMTNVNTTEETYDGEKAVPHHIVKNDEVNSGSRPNPIGIPGSRANLPGAEVSNPPLPTATLNNERNVATTKYAIPRKLQNITKPSGNIKRLTVAVIVDGTYAADPKAQGSEVFVPRPEPELQRFKDIVANAVGFDQQRRDSINISSLPFKTTDLGPVEEKGLFNWQEFLPQAIRNGLIGLVLVLFFLLVLRPFLKWATLGDIKEELSLLPKTVAELQIAQQDQGVLALKSTIPILSRREILEEKHREERERVELKAVEDEKAAIVADNEEIESRKKEKEELIKKIGAIIEESPGKGFRVLHSWFQDDVEDSDGEAA